MGPPKLRTSALPKKKIKEGCRGGGLGKKCLPVVCRDLCLTLALQKEKKIKTIHRQTE